MAFTRIYPRTLAIPLNIKEKNFLISMYDKGDGVLYSYGTILSAIISLRTLQHFHPIIIECEKTKVKIQYKYDEGLPPKIYLFTKSEKNCKRTSIPVREGTKVFPMYCVDLQIK